MSLVANSGQPLPATGLRLFEACAPARAFPAMAWPFSRPNFFDATQQMCCSAGTLRACAPASTVFAGPRPRARRHPARNKTMRYDKSGLYDPAFEHDSCGFGVIANVDGKASAWLVDQAFATLARMSHRGGIGADGITGDGCGMLLYRPTAWLRALASEAGITPAAVFASGHLFLDPNDAALAAAQQGEIEAQLEADGPERRRLARRAGQSGRVRPAGRVGPAAGAPGFRRRAAGHGRSRRSSARCSAHAGWPRRRATTTTVSMSSACRPRRSSPRRWSRPGSCARRSRISTGPN